MHDLNHPLPSDVKSHFEPFQGFEFSSNGRTLLQVANTSLKEGCRFTSKDHATLYDALLTYVESVGEYLAPSSAHPIGNPKPFKATLHSGPIYRAVSERYTNDFAAGRMRLRPLLDYCKAEALKARDFHEGYVHLAVESGTRSHHVIAKAGFDHLILCGSQKGRAATRYGDVLFKIHDPKAFRVRMENTLGARGSLTRRITYRNRRMIAATIPAGLFDPAILMPDRLFDPLYRATISAALFMKSRVNFASDLEVRMAFDMGRRIEEPIDIDDPELGKFVERMITPRRT